jgi:hypothetical protein
VAEEKANATRKTLNRKDPPSSPVAETSSRGRVRLPSRRMQESYDPLTMSSSLEKDDTSAERRTIEGGIMKKNDGVNGGSIQHHRSAVDAPVQDGLSGATTRCVNQSHGDEEMGTSYTSHVHSSAINNFSPLNTKQQVLENYQDVARLASSSSGSTVAMKPTLARHNMNRKDSLERINCHCSKSKCLKLYCDCFQQKEVRCLVLNWGCDASRCVLITSFFLRCAIPHCAPVKVV